MKNINIRDAREKEWFWIDNDFIDKFARLLSPACISVYLSLCRHSNNNNQQCYPSMKLIAQEMKIGTKTVERATKKLEELGLISIVRARKEDGTQANNVYTLLSKRNWKLKPTDTTTIGADRHLEPLPTDISDASRQTPRPHNNTHINNTQLTILSKFDEFWSVYPTKKAKSVAQVSWSKIDPSLYDTIIADVSKRKEQDRQWQNLEYVPHPSTYLNQKRWTDDITPVTSFAPKLSVSEPFTKGKFDNLKGKEIN